MSGVVVITVVAAALLHATWNALVKAGADTTASMGAVVLGHVPFATIGLVYAPSPAVESIPYIVLGAILHLRYQVLLMHSYRAGDLSDVYPIARGSAPLIVAGVSVGIMGVALTMAELLAVALIGLAIASIAFARPNGKARDGTVVSSALMAGACIAAYSLVDGYGARLAGTSLGFYGWLAVGNGIGMILFLGVRAPGAVRDLLRERATVSVLGGGASFGAYALVMWAFTQAPVPLVAAVREISMVFALLIGATFLGERLNAARILAVVAATAGVVMLRIVAT